jgi:hypothetical protein
MFTNPGCPNAADFAAFVAAQLPVQPDWPANPGFSSGQWQWIALEVALDVVNPELRFAGSLIYVLSVYNLALDTLLNIAPDPVGQTVMERLRIKYKIDEPQMGVLTSAGNDVSNATVLNPEFMQRLTMNQLQNLKTPWGRTYVGYAASVGSMWGLS